MQIAGLPSHGRTLIQEGTDGECSAAQAEPVSEQFGLRTEPSVNATTSPPDHNRSSAGVSASSPLQTRREMAEPAVPLDNVDNITACDRNDWGWRSNVDIVPQEAISKLVNGSAGDVSNPLQQRFVPGCVPRCPSLEVDDDNSSTEGVEKLADRLSDRVGTIHVRPGGHIRFYGSTSNFSLLETPPGDVGMNVHWTVRNDGIEHLHRLGLDKKVPSELEGHLMNLYFTWQDPSFHVVDRKIFEGAQEVWHSQMEDTACYSEALRNAM